jgi:hypothetical protein
MEINKELQEMVEDPIEMTEQEQKIAAELEAKTGQTYDPVSRCYNDQNRRVTDLQECARVTLPKPLPTKHEALIEIRRNVHNKIYNEYRQEFCNKNGEQKSNFTEQESRGLNKLQKRIKKDSLVILKTDKYCKFATTYLENYLKMGPKHTSKDKIIERGEIRNIETILKCHCRAWCKMWRSGKNHGHTARIMTSKTTTSNNVASMWLALKDHKEGGKSRGIVTGCNSNSKGLSNSVSDVLEAVANSEESPYEVVSGEDMLARVHEANKRNSARRENWHKRRLRKIETDCDYCPNRLSLVLGCGNCQPKYHNLASATGQDNTNTSEFWDRAAQCDLCGPRVEARIETDCVSCGSPVDKEELKRVALGNDAVGLFPNIKSKNSAKTVRYKVEESRLKFEGFDFKPGEGT